MNPACFAGKLDRRLAYILLSVFLFAIFYSLSYVAWYRSIHRLFSDRLELSLDSAPNGEDFKVSDLAVNSQGDVVVCDRENSRVLCFLADGSFRMEIGRNRGDEEHIFLPSALAFDLKDSLYVACHDEVLIFDPRFNFARKLNFKFCKKPKTGVYEAIDRSTSSGYEFFTKSMAVNYRGDIYLVGYHPCGIVHKFTSQGRWMRSFGNRFEHPNYRIRRYYSGGKIQLEKDMLYLTHQAPYNLTVYDLDGTTIGRFLRPELDFDPRFEVQSTRNTYKSSSRALAILKVDSLLINQFYLTDKGMYIDVYDNKEGFAYHDIPIGAYLLASDRSGNIYYLESNSAGGSIFKGRLLDEYRKFDRSLM